MTELEIYKKALDKISNADWPLAFELQDVARRALAAAERAQAEGGEGLQPAAWRYELANSMHLDGSYSGWSWRIGDTRPLFAPVGSWRNLQPLYAHPPAKASEPHRWIGVDGSGSEFVIYVKEEADECIEHGIPVIAVYLKDES